MSNKLLKNLVGGFLLCLAGVTSASATTYTYEAIDPAGGDAAGNLDYFFASFDDVSKELTVNWTVTENAGVLANGFSLVINNGPNPKDDPNELAMIYFDATGGNPVVTAYKYNNTPFIDSHLSGPTLISSTEQNKIDAINGQSNGTTASYGFTVDTNELAPYFAGFDDSLGVWFHTFAVSTAYGQNGALTSWDYKEQGFFDGENLKTTEVPEPSTMLLLGSAMVGMRFKKRKSA